jgi:hypothetical protein
MKKPEKQDVVTTIRLPVDLHRELKETARIAGHAMNIEIIARLVAHPKGTTLADIAKQNTKTQEMIQQIIDAISPRK